MAVSTVRCIQRMKVTDQVFRLKTERRKHVNHLLLSVQPSQMPEVFSYSLKTFHLQSIHLSRYVKSEFVRLRTPSG